MPKANINATQNICCGRRGTPHPCGRVKSYNEAIIIIKINVYFHTGTIRWGYEMCPKKKSLRLSQKEWVD